MSAACEQQGLTNDDLCLFMMSLLFTAACTGEDSVFAGCTVMISFCLSMLLYVPTVHTHESRCDYWD